MSTTPLLSPQEIQTISETKVLSLQEEIKKYLRDARKQSAKFGFMTGFNKFPMEEIDLEGLTSQNELIRLPAYAYAEGYKAGREFAYKKTGSGTKKHSKKSRKTRRHARK